MVFLISVAVKEGLLPTTIGGTGGGGISALEDPAVPGEGPLAGGAADEWAAAGGSAVGLGTSAGVADPVASTLAGGDCPGGLTTANRWW